MSGGQAEKKTGERLLLCWGGRLRGSRESKSLFDLFSAKSVGPQALFARGIDAAWPGLQARFTRARSEGRAKFVRQHADKPPENIRHPSVRLVIRRPCWGFKSMEARMTTIELFDRMTEGPDFLSGPTDRIPAAICDAYHSSFSRAFEIAPELFHWIERGDLGNSHVNLAVAMENGIARAGFLFEIDTATNVLFIRGLYSDGTLRGVTRRLLMNAVGRIHADGRKHLSVAAELRILPDGTVNPKAARFFAGLTFVPIAVISYRVLGGINDAHLFQMSDFDGESHRSLRMATSVSAMLVSAPETGRAKSDGADDQ